MSVYTSSGSFEPESIKHEQKMEVWVKKSMKFTRIVKSASQRSTHANGEPKSAGMFPYTLPAYMRYRTANNTCERVTKPVTLRE